MLNQDKVFKGVLCWIEAVNIEAAWKAKSVTFKGMDWQEMEFLKKPTQTCF